MHNPRLASEPRSFGASSRYARPLGQPSAPEPCDPYFGTAPGTKDADVGVLRSILQRIELAIVDADAIRMMNSGTAEAIFSNVETAVQPPSDPDVKPSNLVSEIDDAFRRLATSFAHGRAVAQQLQRLA